MKVGAQTLASWCHICSVDLESKSSLYVVFFVIWFILLSNSDLAWLLKKLGEQNVSLFWVLHLHIGTVELVWVYIFQVGRGFFLITFAVAASSSIFVFFVCWHFAFGSFFDFRVNCTLSPKILGQVQSPPLRYKINQRLPWLIGVNY